MCKSLFLHEVKPPTSKTFYFFHRKGITPNQLHPPCPDFLLQLVVFLNIRSAFVMPTLQVRSTSVSGPFLGMGEKWDLQGICKGLTQELRKRHRNTEFLKKITKTQLQKEKKEKSINDANPKTFTKMKNIDLRIIMFGFLG